MSDKDMDIRAWNRVDKQWETVSIDVHATDIMGDRFEIHQYIGRKDKLGNKIFHKDKIKGIYRRDGIDNIDEEQDGVVEWYEPLGMWICDNNQRRILNIFQFIDIEIIGNVYKEYKHE